MVNSFKYLGGLKTFVESVGAEVTSRAEKARTAFANDFRKGVQRQFVGFFFMFEKLNPSALGMPGDFSFLTTDVSERWLEFGGNIG